MRFRQTKACVCQEISAKIDFLILFKNKLNENTVLLLLLCLVLRRETFSGKWKFAAFPKYQLKINNSLRAFTRSKHWILNSDKFMLHPCWITIMYTYLRHTITKNCLYPYPSMNDQNKQMLASPKTDRQQEDVKQLWTNIKTNKYSFSLAAWSRSQTGAYHLESFDDHCKMSPQRKLWGYIFKNPLVRGLFSSQRNV